MPIQRKFQYEDGGKAPLADLEATDYTAKGGSVSVVADNLGTGSAKNASLVLYALSASGEFEDWTFAFFSTSDLWGPKEERTARATLSYQAPCPRLLAVPYYDAVEVSPNLSPDKELLAASEGSNAADAQAASLLRRRQRAERANLALLGK